MKRVLFFLCTALVLAVGFSDLISKTVLPITAAESRRLIFNHGLHVDNECTYCHVNAKTSKAGLDDLLPTHDNCGECHDVSDNKGCVTCHLDENPAAGPRVKDYSPKFTHAAHVDAKLTCTNCHADLDTPLPTETIGHFPTMAECMKCHTEKLVSTDCALCHLPDDELRPKDHMLEWLSLHGAAAAESQASCTVCHSLAEDCQACHNGDAVSSPHPRNYIARHGQEAHMSEMRCSVCHDEQSFCNECHKAMNILPAGHYRPGWATTSGGKHAEEAQFDLQSCIACHDTPGKTPVCATCHREDQGD
jgi:hypothetical protein